MKFSKLLLSMEWAKRSASRVGNMAALGGLKPLTAALNVGHAGGHRRLGRSSLARPSAPDCDRKDP